MAIQLAFLPLGPTELVALLFLAILLFGPKQLPELGGAFGKTIKNFKASQRDDSESRELTDRNTSA